jgi:hypothetical protein
MMLERFSGLCATTAAPAPSTPWFGDHRLRLEMPFRPKRKQSIGVPIGQSFEDVLTLSDIEALALQVNDYGFRQLVQSKPSIFPSMSRHDHLPQ